MLALGAIKVVRDECATVSNLDSRLKIPISFERMSRIGRRICTSVDQNRNTLVSSKINIEKVFK